MGRMAQIQCGGGASKAPTEETRHRAKASREVRHAGSVNFEWFEGYRTSSGEPK
jgi:hypothetical protein